MEPQSIERRLAAILAADVVGYSRLMGEDEAGTLARLKSHRRDLIDPKIAEHHGRVVKLMGDGALVEFASVVDAVQCAVEIQRAMRHRNAGTPEERRVEFRIGINLGDVIVEGEDIYGDGVNVAARLEGLAEPGGVCVSGTVHDHIAGKTEIAFDDDGEQSVKNIRKPVRVWRWHAGVTVDVAPALELPDKPSIAVLPFENMSGDPEQDYFADGIAEDITTALSRIERFFVTARNSSFTYKGRVVDVKQIGRDLGVRYVLEGSVRKSGLRLRVTAQLVDTLTGHHIWAERYDRDLSDIFEVQDEITRNVVASTQTQVQLSEASYFENLEKPSLPVWGLVNRTWKLVYEMTPESLHEGRGLAEQAIALDPGSGRAHQALATVLWQLYWLHATQNPEQTIQEAQKAAEQALRLNEHDEYVHWVYGQIQMVQGFYDKGVAELERAIEINPNCSLAYGSLGTVLNHAGRPEESIVNNEIAIRSNPRDPTIFFRYAGLALSYFLLDKCETAVDWAKKSVLLKPTWYLGHAVLAASYSELERIQDAEAAIRDYLRHFPDASIADIVRIPFRLPEHSRRLVDALRNAGLPE